MTRYTHALIVAWLVASAKPVWEARLSQLSPGGSFMAVVARLPSCSVDTIHGARSAQVACLPEKGLELLSSPCKHQMRWPFETKEATATIAVAGQPSKLAAIATLSVAARLLTP